MTQVASIQDFREYGPPGDIGVFQKSAYLVFYFTFSGVGRYVALSTTGTSIQDPALHVVLNSCAALLPNGGVISFKNDGTIYTLTTKLNDLPPGLVFDFNNSRLDVSAIDDIVFNFNNDDTNWTHQRHTGIKNVAVTGDVAKVNTLLAKITQVSKGVVFDDISLYDVNNALWIRGASYGDCMTNVRAYHMKRTFVHLQAILVAAVNYASNAFRVDKCEASAMAPGGNYGVLNDREAGATMAAEAVTITTSWFESMNYPIYTDGYYTTIDNCRIIGNIKGVTFASHSAYGYVHDTTFTGVAGHTAAISFEAAVDSPKVVQCHFRDILVVAIDCTQITYLTFTDSTVQLSDAAAVGVNGNFDYSSIDNVKFFGQAPDQGIGITATSAIKTGNTITNCKFIHCVKGIYVNLYADAWIVTDNYFFHNTLGMDLHAARTTRFNSNRFVSNTADLVAFGTACIGNIYDKQYKGASDANLLNNGTAEYFPIEGTKLKSTVELAHVLVMDKVCYVTNLYVKLTAAPTGATKSYTISLRKNGGTVTPTVTITDAATSGTWCGAYALAIGDQICFISNGGANTPTASQPLCVLEMMCQ